MIREWLKILQLFVSTSKERSLIPNAEKQFTFQFYLEWMRIFEWTTKKNKTFYQ